MAAGPLDEATTKEVIRQVEFYFSDSNIPRDKFLRNTINDSEDGMINLALICTFNKMKGYLKLIDVTPETIPEDILQAVAETLRISASLRVSEDGKKVGRISALLKPEEVIEQLDMRTVAASPLEYNTRREDVEAFFGQHAKVCSVRLPRHICDKRVFCGAALIEFLTPEEAQGILSKSLLFNGAQLDLMPKKEFDAERKKKAEEHERSQASAGSNSKNSSSTEKNSSSSYTKGLIVAFKLENRQPSPSSPGISAEENATQGGGNLGKEGETLLENAPQEREPASSENIPNGDDQNTTAISEEEKGTREEETTGSEINVAEEEDAAMKKEAKSEEAAEKVSETVEKRKLEDCSNNFENVVLREDLKAAFQMFGTVKYVDFKMGDEAGFVRFEQPEAAQKARAAAVLSPVGGLMVKNFLATLEPVTGDGEREYWTLLRCNQEKRWENKSSHGRGRGGKFRGRGKHRRSADKDSGRPNKVQKVEQEAS